MLFLLLFRYASWRKQEDSMRKSGSQWHLQRDGQGDATLSRWQSDQWICFKQAALSRDPLQLVTSFYWFFNHLLMFKCVAESLCIYTLTQYLSCISLGTPRCAETSMEEKSMKRGAPEKATRSFKNNEKFYFPVYSD